MAGDPSVGRVLAGRYSILRPLGQGGMGAVYLAHQQALQRDVVVKLIRAGQAGVDDAGFRKRFEAEALATSRLKDPHIVAIFDYGFDGDTPFIVLEHLDGVDLAAEMRSRGVLSLDEALHVMRGIASALVAASAAGIVHRDLKPANVFLTKTAADPRFVKVLDFGISKILGGVDATAQTETGSVVGTPGYVAPERLVSDGDDPRSDLYALGVIAWEMLAGRAPFVEPTPLALALRHLHDAPPSLGSVVTVPNAVEMLVSRLLAKTAAERPDAGEVLAALTSIPSEAGASGPRDRPPTEPAPSTPATETMTSVVTPSLPASRAGAEATTILAPAETPPTQNTAAEVETARPLERAPASPRIRSSSVLLFGGLAGLAVIGSLLAAAWWVTGNLPDGNRSVRVEVRNSGPQADDRLVRAVARMAADRLAKADRRYSVLVDGAESASVVAEIDFRLAPRGDGLESIEMSARLRRPGRRELMGATARAESIAAALELVVPPMSGKIAEGLAARDGPDEAERAEMAAIGTYSVEAYRAYRDALHEYYRTQTVDPVPLRSRFQEALRIDPEWHHARVALAMVNGWLDAESMAIVEQGLGCETRPSKDVDGCDLLKAASAMQHQQSGIAAEILRAQTRKHPSDLLAQFLNYRAVTFTGQQAEAIGVARWLHDAYPELQFGTDLCDMLGTHGRAADILATVERWLERAPHAEQALIQTARLRVGQGARDEARRATTDLLVLFGETPNRLVIVADLALDARDSRLASVAAEKLTRLEGIQRARGFMRFGLASIMEGRFGAAEEALTAAIRDGRAFGIEFEMYQTSLALAELYAARGDDEAAATAIGPAEAMFERLSMANEVAAAKYAAALWRAKGTCPDVEAALAEVPGADARKATEPYLKRMAAERGCVPCEEVVALGLVTREASSRSLLLLGRCAISTGRGEFAAEVLERATRFSSGSGGTGADREPYSSILAYYYLGNTLASLGKQDKARSAYETFLRHWGTTDRPMPEVDAARAALATLANTPATANGPAR